MRTYFGHILKATLVVAVVLAAAAWPVQAWFGGRDALVGLLTAGAVSLAGYALGRLPHLFLRHGPDAIFHAALAGLGVRLLATLALAAPLMLSEAFPLTPFAIGLVLTYFALLILEVWDLVVQGRADAPADTGPREDTSPGADGASIR